MELIRGIHNLRAKHCGVAATIGNFDGVHLGHQAVIAQLTDRARTLGVPSMVILFEPQPQEYFRAAQAVPRLTRFREKLLALRECSVDYVLCLRFDARLAGLSHDQFVREIMVDALQVRYLVVGDDFRFGSRRSGDFSALVKAGEQYRFEVVSAPTFCIDGERVSSTRIRDALAKDELQVVQRLLGRPYRMCGRVVSGNRLGRTLGIPTANVQVRRHSVAIKGIYVVEVSGLAPAPLPGVASLGTRPTVGGVTLLLEVHILDFSEDIYDRQIGVDFLCKLREEARFASLSEMQAQINHDIEETRRYFSARSAGKTAAV